MARLLRMPSVAANAVEAVLAGWSVSEGAAFGADEAIATVETDKAVVDIEPDGAGVLLKTLAAPGSVVAVGEPIAVLGVVGERVDVEALLAELDDTGPPVPSAAVEGAASRVFASPLARRLAREAGLTLADLVGTGPGGRVLRRDVQRAVAERGGAAAVADPRQPPASDGAPPSSGWTDVPHTRMRAAIAARLSESKQPVPHFYLRAGIRADRLMGLRAELDEPDRPRISVNDLLVKAVAVAHQRVPELNVCWTPEGVRHFEGVDIGVAVATDGGLLIPVVRGVDRLPLGELARTMGDLVARARGGQLRQEELEGGSVTVSNLGPEGVEEFSAIINPPQAAILAVGAVRPEPVVDAGRVVASQVLRVTLSVDHRPVDGVVAARWLREFVALVEHPARILAGRR